MNLFPLFQGFGITASLIVAIGAQNAFVLKQGIRRKHRLATVITCILCDFLLITLGVCGIGFLIHEHPQLMVWIKIFGAAFLLSYGLKSIYSAFNPKKCRLDHEKGPIKLRTTLLALLAFTFLNPHTYLDTVVLIGGSGAGYALPEQLQYVFGALCASSLWFVGLTYGASKLSPYFENARTWQYLDSFIGLFMFFIAWTLIKPLITG